MKTLKEFTKFEEAEPYGIELDELLCDIIITRWCKYTGNNNIKINGSETKWETKQHNSKLESNR